jgi:TFIIF-interacting CTD phosphatase-like protein
MNAVTDPSKLIDLELVNLLKFCKDLQTKHRDSEDYQEDLMMKTLELGKKTKEKTLLLDMDETLIAAKFDGKQPKNFKTDFSFDFSGAMIHVRFRPYLTEALEKLG